MPYVEQLREGSTGIRVVVVVVVVVVVEPGGVVVMVVVVELGAVVVVGEEIVVVVGGVVVVDGLVPSKWLHRNQSCPGCLRLHCHHQRCDLHADVALLSESHLDHLRRSFLRDPRRVQSSHRPD